jgi:hypothetical protein
MLDEGQVNIPEGNDVPDTVANANPASTADTDRWRGRIAKSRRYRRDLTEDWRTNIDFRRGKVFDADSDMDRIAITYDWSATKAKQAQLFSQVPQVRLKAKNKRYEKGVPVFAKKLNDALSHADVGTAMDECLPNCINAAGVGLVLIAYETRTEDRVLPSVTKPAPPAPMMIPGQPPPPAAPPMDVNGAPDTGEAEAPGAPEETPEQPIPYTTARRFTIDSLSPSDALWDLTFTGSNFNRAPWVGRSGRMHFSKAMKEFGLKPSDKATVCGTGTQQAYDRLSEDADKDRFAEANMVEFDEVFYWRYLYHDDETSFEAIQRLVFVHGRGTPVVNEPWKGQRRLDADGQESETGDIIVGSCKFPIQFLTLTYVTDSAIPPSDSAMGRPQIEELIQGRTDMMLQRRQSRPMRWMNNNLVPPALVTAIMRGTWQGVVPINGPGERAFGEVARASYPHEDDTFDRIAKNDLMETWNIGGSQGIGGGSNTQIRTAAEANNAQSNMQTRVGYERARCNKFFCNIAEVLAGLICLFGEWDEEETAALQGMDVQHMPSYYMYTTRTDSSVLLDAEQRYSRLERYTNIAAKSGLADMVPVLQEMASLVDVDESTVARPTGGKPEPVNVSLRVDEQSLQDPIVVAMLIESGQFPKPETLEMAKKAIMQSRQLPVPPPPPGMPPGGPGGAPPPESAPQPAQPADANAHWDMAGRVNKRQQDGR